MEVDPRACDAVDVQMINSGERWVCDERPLDLDALMSAREIADRFGLEVHDIRNWARRHPEKIRAQKHKNGVRYLVRDVLKYHLGAS